MIVRGKSKYTDGKRINLSLLQNMNVVSKILLRDSIYILIETILRPFTLSSNETLSSGPLQSDQVNLV